MGGNERNLIAFAGAALPPGELSTSFGVFEDSDNEG